MAESGFDAEVGSEADGAEAVGPGGGAARAGGAGVGGKPEPLAWKGIVPN